MSITFIDIPRICEQQKFWRTVHMHRLVADAISDTGKYISEQNKHILSERYISERFFFVFFYQDSKLM